MARYGAIKVGGEPYEQLAIEKEKSERQRKLLSEVFFFACLIIIPLFMLHKGYTHRYWWGGGWKKIR